MKERQRLSQTNKTEEFYHSRSCPEKKNVNRNFSWRRKINGMSRNFYYTKKEHKRRNKKGKRNILFFYS